MLGVHVRGTDFNRGFGGHPVAVTLDEYVAAAREEYSSGRYDGIFLASDDGGAVERFRAEFGGAVRYYDDVFRTSGDVGPHSTPSDRPLHRYRLGLETLRDIYTLAACRGLVCGLTNVSSVARFVNLAFCGEFERLVVLDRGIKGVRPSPGPPRAGSAGESGEEEI